MARQEFPNGYYLVTLPDSNTEIVQVKNGIAFGSFLCTINELVATGANLFLLPKPLDFLQMMKDIVASTGMFAIDIDKTGRFVCTYANTDSGEILDVRADTPEQAIYLAWLETNNKLQHS